MIDALRFPAAPTHGGAARRRSAGAGSVDPSSLALPPTQQIDMTPLIADMIARRETLS